MQRRNNLSYDVTRVDARNGASGYDCNIWQVLKCVYTIADCRRTKKNTEKEKIFRNMYEYFKLEM